MNVQLDIDLVLFTYFGMSLQHNIEKEKQIPLHQ